MAKVGVRLSELVDEMEATFTFTLSEATQPCIECGSPTTSWRRIVSLKGIRLPIGFAGIWCGLAPDDSPLLLRDVGSQEIYALDLQLP